MPVQGRHWLLVPWLVDSMLEMVATFLHVTVQAARGQWDMCVKFNTFIFYIFSILSILILLTMQQL